VLIVLRTVDKWTGRKEVVIMHKIRIVILLVVMLAGAGRVQAALTWDIYKDAVIDEVGDFYGRVHIYDTPPEHTSVNMVGGRVDVMWVYDASTLNMTGGRVSTLLGVESSTVNISGGAEVRSAGVWEFGTVNMSGGDVEHVRTKDHTTMNISGGSVEYAVEVRDLGVLNMTGGQVHVLTAFDSAFVNLLGGNISEMGIAERGGRKFDGVINVYGYDLVKTSSGGKYGHGQVYGSWYEDTRFTIELRGSDTYSGIALIPEPTTLLLLGIGAAIVRMRKQ